MCVIVHNFRVIHADSGGSGALYGGEKFFEPHLHYSKCRDSTGKHFSYLIPEVSVCSECVLYCVLYCTVLYCAGRVLASREPAAVQLGPGDGVPAQQEDQHHLRHQPLGLAHLHPAVG